MKLTPKIANRLFVMLIIVVLVFVVFAVSFMLKNKEAFTENPFVYGAKKMDLGQCNCNCYKEDNPQPISFYFNQTSFSQQNLERRT